MRPQSCSAHKFPSLRRWKIALLAAAFAAGYLWLPCAPFDGQKHALAQRIQLKTYPTRVPAPSLDGAGEWINAAGPIRLKDLRGKFVILDFWTYCCINCMHILPELKKLERAYPNQLVVIGVHSAKFFTERAAPNIRQAVMRYEIEHPVVNDPYLVLWRKFRVEVWPTLCVIDPEGYLVASHKGEITFETLDRFLKRSLPGFRRKGLLDTTPLRFDLERYQAEETPLRFPGKVLADEAGGRLFIADSSHNRIVITKLDGTLLDVVGTGAIGRDDGRYDEASFDHPQGMALEDESLYVADTENHLVRKIDLKEKWVTTVAGTGKQARRPVNRMSGRPTARALSSPWDLWVQGGELYIAMAGLHQIWRMTRGGERIGPYAGNGVEDVLDGPMLPRSPYQQGFASFAQPSGLACDDRWLYVADSEGSSIRAVPLGANQRVRTVVGTSRLPRGRLFTFGDRDGGANQALLQHPIGLTYHRGQLYVADTYNNKLKEIELKQRVIKTIAGDGQAGRTDLPARFDEPAGLSAAGDRLYVADTNNHLVRVLDLEGAYKIRTLQIKGLRAPNLPAEPPSPAFPGAKRISFNSTRVRPTGGRLRLAVELSLAPGYKINPQAPMSYVVGEVEGEAGIIDPVAVGKPTRIPQPASQFEIALPLRAKRGNGRIKISLTYYFCREGAEALCKVGGVSWSGEVTLSETAKSDRVRLNHVVR